MKPHWIVRLTGRLSADTWDALIVGASVVCLCAVLLIWLFGE